MQQLSPAQAGSDLLGELSATLDPGTHHTPALRLQSPWGGLSAAGWVNRPVGRGHCLPCCWLGFHIFICIGSGRLDSWPC